MNKPINAPNFGVIKIKKIKVTDKLIISCVLVLFAWILAGLNTWNPDYDLYKLSYDNMSWEKIADTRAIGYSFVIFIFKSLGFSFQGYMALVCFLVLLSIYKSIKQYTDNCNLAFFAYLIYPFLIDPIQIKQWVASAIVLYSLRYLTETTNKNIIRFVICVLLATLIHSSCVYYAVFILIFLIKSPFALLVTSFVASIGMLSLASILIDKIRYLDFFVQWTKGQLDNYLLSANEVASKTYLFLLIGLTIGVMLYIKEYGFTRGQKVVNNQIREYSDILTKVSLLCIPSLGFMIVHQEFYRLFRGMFFVYYAMFFYKRNALSRSFKILFIIAGIAIALFMFYKEFSSTAYYYEAVTKPLFENNIFFDWFE